MKNTVSRRRSRTTFRPRLESLETRLTPTTFTVSSLADSGAGSLRAAITSVNADNTPDEIDFSVAGVIQLTSGAMPAITNHVIINGTTAPGFAGAPVVEIDNNGFAGLTLSGSDSSLVSLSIVNATGTGVTLENAGIIVIGNYIGLALDGSVKGNTGVGLFVDTSSIDLIGGTAPADRNVVSGNGGGGIQLGPSGSKAFPQDATVDGNFIGTDPTGQTAAANQGNGITNFSSGNSIGGTEAGAGNTIAFNTQAGVYLGSGYAAIQRNSIFSNGGPGIEFANGNADQPALVLTSAYSPAIGKVQMSGILTATSDATYSLEFFATPTQFPAQAQYLLGTLNVTTNADGTIPFVFTSTITQTESVSLTATATILATFLGPDTSTVACSRDIAPAGNANSLYACSLYGLLLNRAPDTVYWIMQLNNGATPASVVLGIEASAEYLSDRVVAIYAHYLGRVPDPAGETFWTNFLNVGGTFEQVSESLVSSQEYYVLQGGNNERFITGLYIYVLDREPSTAELAGWEAALDSGISRASVAVAFLTSQEYRTILVQADYMTFLNRPADSGGLTGWVNALNAGFTDQDVLAGILGSPEGFRLWS